MRVARFPFTLTRTTPLHNKCKQCYFSSASLAKKDSPSSSPTSTPTPSPSPPVNGSHSPSTSQDSTNTVENSQPQQTPKFTKKSREFKPSLPAIQGIDPLETIDKPLHYMFAKPFDNDVNFNLNYMKEGATPEQAEEYLKLLREGQSIDARKWDELISLKSTITEPQANELLKYGQAAKLITPERYFLYLYRLVLRSEWISVHLGLTAMIESRVPLSNYHYYSLARASMADYHTVARFISQINLGKKHPTRIQLIPQVLELAKFTVSNIQRTMDPKMQKTHVLKFHKLMPLKLLGAPMYNITIDHFNSVKDMAMVTIMSDEMRKFNILPDMKTYELLSRGVTLPQLNKILLEMKDRGMVPSVLMYTKLMMRFRSDFKLFSNIHQEMLKHHAKLDVPAYEAVIMTHIMHGYKAEAFNSLRTMLESNLLPDQGLMNTLDDAFKSDPETLAQLQVLWDEVKVRLAAVEQQKKAATLAKMTHTTTSDEW